MARIKTKQVQGVGRITLEYAIDQFMRHNRLKNLSPRTIEYYTEDLRYFQKITEVTYLDEITDKLYEDFILHEMDKGNKMTAVNCRTRGLRVFLRFCAKREYMELIHIPMMKVDESFKDPYTDAELDKLLKRPTGDSFVEWRCWAAINTFLATGIRANTLVNIKISDVDFENDTIHLSKLKNRRQQFVPMSQSLKAALNIYLKLWDWNSDDYLFPANDGKQMPVSGIGGSIRRYNLSRGVSKTSMHLFRHTFAKNYIMAGGGMAQLQAILGHSTLDMTKKYVNLYGKDIQRDFDLLNPLNNIMAARKVDHSGKPKKQ